MLESIEVHLVGSGYNGELKVSGGIILGLQRDIPPKRFFLELHADYNNILNICLATGRPIFLFLCFKSPEKQHSYSSNVYRRFSWNICHC